MNSFIQDIGVTFKATAIFFLLHILIAIAGMQYGGVMKLQALLVFLIGCRGSLRGEKMVVLCAVSYIAGAEVLWRITGASIFWEFGKYAIAGIFILDILQRRERGRPTISLILYFLLLLPAILWTTSVHFEQWRKIVSFNISGPLALFVCGLGFSKVSFSKKDLQKFFTWFLAPVVSVAFITLRGIRATQELVWGTTSSKVASGGFGPNQVSSILGFGVFLCIVIILLQKNKLNFNIMFLMLCFWLFVQAILTFSRGGVIQTVLSLGVFFIFLFKQKGGKNFIPITFLGLFLTVVAIYYIIPKLDSFTGGALKRRYTEKEKIGDIEVYETTGRMEIIYSDMKAFQSSFLGIGLGNSPDWHAKDLGVRKAPHTEWTRMLAEHGMLGLFSIFVLLSWIVERCKKQKDPLYKALVISFAVSGCFYMVHGAMRLALSGLLIGFLGSEAKESEEE